MIRGAPSPIAYAEAVCERAAGLEAQRAGRFDEALRRFRAAERRFHELGDQLQVAWSMQNIGQLEELTGRTDHALAMFTGAETLFRHHGEKTGFPLMFRRRADVLRRLGRGEAALAACCEGEGLYRTFEDPVGIASCLSSKAACYLVMGRAKEAEAALSEAWWRIEPLGRAPGEAEFLIHVRRWQAGVALHAADAHDHLAQARAIAVSADLVSDRGNPDLLAAMAALDAMAG